MKRLRRIVFPFALLAVLNLLLPRPARAAVAFVQSAGATNASSGASVQLTNGVAYTAGNFVWVACGWVGTTQDVTSVVDDVSNTYTPAAAVLHGNGYSIRIFYAVSVLTGTVAKPVCNFSATVPGTKVIAMHEYSGMTNSSPIDQTSTASPTSSTNVTCGSMTTTNANDLIVAMAVVDSGVTAAGSGYTLRQTGFIADNGTLDRIVTSTGSYSPSFTQSSALNSICQAVSFKADALGGGTPAPVKSPTRIVM